MLGSQVIEERDLGGSVLGPLRFRFARMAFGRSGRKNDFSGFSLSKISLTSCATKNDFAERCFYCWRRACLEVALLLYMFLGVLQVDIAKVRRGSSRPRHAARDMPMEAPSGPLARGSKACPSSCKRDLDKLSPVAKAYSVPVLNISAGGSDYKEPSIPIYSEVTKSVVFRKLGGGHIFGWGSCVPTPTVVTQIGPGPFLQVLVAHPEVNIIIGGHAYDPAPFTAWCTFNAFAGKRTYCHVLALELHMAQIMERGGVCPTPKSSLAIYTDGYFDIRPFAPRSRCTPTSVAAMSARHTVFRPSRPYTVKLEGGKAHAFRTIFFGSFCDPISCTQPPVLLVRIRAAGKLGSRPHIRVRAAGRVLPSDETVVVGEARKNAGARDERGVDCAHHMHVHAPYEGQKETSGVLIGGWGGGWRRKNRAGGRSRRSLDGVVEQGGKEGGENGGADDRGTTHGRKAQRSGCTTSRGPVRAGGWSMGSDHIEGPSSCGGMVDGLGSHPKRPRSGRSGFEGRRGHGDVKGKAGVLKCLRSGFLGPSAHEVEVPAGGDLIQNARWGFEGRSWQGDFKGREWRSDCLRSDFVGARGWSQRGRVGPSSRTRVFGLRGVQRRVRGWSMDEPIMDVIRTSAFGLREAQRVVSNTCCRASWDPAAVGMVDDGASMPKAQQEPGRKERRCRRELAAIFQNPDPRPIDQCLAHIATPRHKEHSGELYTVFRIERVFCEQLQLQIDKLEVKTLERLVHSTLRARGAAIAPYPCPGCGVKHREFYLDAAAGGIDGVCEVIEFWLGALGQAINRQGARFGIMAILVNARDELFGKRCTGGGDHLADTNSTGQPRALTLSRNAAKFEMGLDL
ncbi:hypothetical protein B0H13DRAFT_1906859 [Mycena leptocephala]|nr:hypothetical protein B0H13DRAFT_1906859 [Mycena leptocephala]